MASVVTYNGLSFVSSDGINPDGSLPGEGGNLIQQNFLAISSALEDFTVSSSGITLSQLNAVSGYLYGRIDTVSGYLQSNGGISLTQLNNVSGYLYGRIDTASGYNNVKYDTILNSSNVSGYLTGRINLVSGYLAGLTNPFLKPITVHNNYGSTGQGTVINFVDDNTLTSGSISFNTNMNFILGSGNAQSFVGNYYSFDNPILLANHNPDPPNGLAGQIFYNPVTNKVRYYNGGGWLDIDPIGVSGYLYGRINSVSGYAENVYAKRTYLDTVSGYLMTNGSGVSSSGPPGGSNTYVQFNDGGIFGGNSGFIFNKTTGKVSLNGNLTANLITEYGLVEPVTPLVDAATIVTNASGSSWFSVALSGNRTLSNPSGATDGQIFRWEIQQDSIGSRSLTLDNKFVSLVGNINLSTSSGAIDYIGAKYNATKDKFYVLGFVRNDGVTPSIDTVSGYLSGRIDTVSGYLVGSISATNTQLNSVSGYFTGLANPFLKPITVHNDYINNGQATAINFIDDNTTASGSIGFNGNMIFILESGNISSFRGNYYSFDNPILLPNHNATINDPPNALAGQIYFNGNSDKIRYYNGNGWLDIDTSSISGYLSGRIDTVSGVMVRGPSSSTDQSIIRWNGTTGRLAEDSLVKVSNNGVITTSGRIETAQSIIDASTIATDASSGSFFKVTLGGNRTLGNPTNAIDGQLLRWQFKQNNTGSNTITLDTKFNTGAFTVTLSTASGKRDYLASMYDSVSDKFDVIGFLTGY